MSTRHVLAGSLVVVMLAGPALFADPPKDAQGVFVAVGYGGRRMVSTDGRTWTITAEWGEKGGDDCNNLMGIAFGQGKFVVAGGGGGGPYGKSLGHILVSKDGRDWKEVYQGKFRVNPVLFGNNRFVAGGPNHNILYSLDGENWKEGAKLTAKEASHYRHGAFGNDWFVFIGNAGGSSPVTWVAVTKDGETLEHQAVDLPPVSGLAFGNGRFIAVGPNGLRMSSKDGKTWDKAEPVAGEEFSWITWSGEKFFCGGKKGLFSSKDGLTWEKVAENCPCHMVWTDGVRGVGTTWPGQMWYSADLKTWEKGQPLTPNGINKVGFGIPTSQPATK